VTLFYGKKDPVAEPKLKLKDYLTAPLPTPPPNFGWDYLVKDWGMLANDSVGDCVIASGLHETLLWRASAGQPTNLTPQCALDNYSAITGYDPAKPSTDQGTDMQTAANYRVKHGLVDADGNTHQIAVWIGITLDQLAAVTWIFGAVGIGIQVPAYCQDQFSAGQPWTVQKANAKIEGGHAIPVVGDANGMFKVVTWGQIQLVDPNFLAQYMDEGFCYLSTEELANGVNLDGFDLAQLQDDVKQLAA
jgi:hypothetical protein